MIIHYMSGSMPEYWSSRSFFILASIGAAIGIGNIWRFPYLVYSNGGGAFLIPYFIALVTAGIPLLLLEFSLGFSTRRGAPGAFTATAGNRYAFAGWLAMIVGFATMCYYAIIVAWSADFTFFSLTQAYADHAETFFFNNFLNIPKTIGGISGINLAVVAGLALTWIWVFISIFRGVRSVEKMIRITVILPWILIVVFVIQGLMLPGAMDGIYYYLNPDFSRLTDPNIWIEAYGQIFFTLSIGWSCMIAYAKFLPEDLEFGKSAIIIALSNSVTSLIAGLAVFPTLGYLALQTGVPVSDVAKGGIELAFVSYPTSISLLPFGSVIFGVLFFLLLMTLGVDSIFATIEGVATGIRDYFNVRKIVIVSMLCIAGFCIGLLFTTSSGYYYLDIADYYISSFALVLVGLLEAAVIGYIYGPELMRRFINLHSDVVIGKWWNVCIKIIIPAALGIIIVTTLWERINSAYGRYPAWANAAGWLLVLLIIITGAVLTIGLSGKLKKTED